MVPEQVDLIRVYMYCVAQGVILDPPVGSVLTSHEYGIMRYLSMSNAIFQ